MTMLVTVDAGAPQAPADSACGTHPAREDVFPATCTASSATGRPHTTAPVPPPKGRLVHMDPEEIVETLLMVQQQTCRHPRTRHARTVAARLRPRGRLGRRRAHLRPRRQRSSVARQLDRGTRHPDREPPHLRHPIAELVAACSAEERDPGARPRGPRGGRQAHRRVLGARSKDGDGGKPAPDRFDTARPPHTSAPRVNVATTCRPGINMDAVLPWRRPCATQPRDRRPRQRRLRQAGDLRQHGRGQPLHGRSGARRRRADAVVNVGIPARAWYAPWWIRCRKTPT